MPNSKTKPFPLMVSLLSIFSIIAMLMLGFWQLERKQQKQARLEQIKIGQEQHSLALRNIIDTPEQYQDFTVVASGYADGSLFFIDNKIHNGVPGFYVLQPIETEFGTVIVNRGWVQSTGNRQQLPQVNELTGEVSIVSMVSLPSDNVFVSETNTNYGQFPVLLQQVDLVQIERHLAREVLPFVLLAAPDDNSAFVRDWNQVVMPPEKHLGYAIQWFGLAIAGLTVYLLSMGKYYKQIEPVDP